MTWHTLRPLLLMKSLTVTGNLGEDSKLDVALAYADNGHRGTCSGRLRDLLCRCSRAGSTTRSGTSPGSSAARRRPKDSKLSEMLGRLGEACNEGVVKVDGKNLQVSERPRPTRNRSRRG